MPSSDGAKNFAVIDGTADSLELTTRCAHPRCRSEFRIPVAPGRRRQYCSETCKSAADRDYKRAKATVDHYQQLLQDARRDLSTFGRSDSEALSADVATDQYRATLRLREAVTTAKTAVAFAQPGDERLHQILSELVAAIGQTAEAN